MGDILWDKKHVISHLSTFAVTIISPWLKMSVFVYVDPSVLIWYRILKSKKILSDFFHLSKL